jgi:hypothetical protein
VSYTAQDVINLALWQLGVLGPGETLSSAQNADLLKVLNVLIGRWNADETLQLSITGAAYSLQANKASYLIGLSSGEFVGARPSQLLVANLLLPSGSVTTRIPLEIVNQIDRVNQNPSNLKNLYPSQVSYTKTFDASGNGLIQFWPIPTQVYLVELSYPTQMALFAALTDPVNLPDYYIEPLASNVALRFAPMFRKPQDPAIIANALNGLQKIRNINYEPVKRNDSRRGCYWDYLTGEMRESR